MVEQICSSLSENSPEKDTGMNFDSVKAMKLKVE
jgi:hypothetical protein